MKNRKHKILFTIKDKNNKIIGSSFIFSRILLFNKIKRFKYKNYICELRDSIYKV